MDSIKIDFLKEIFVQCNFELKFMRAFASFVALIYDHMIYFFGIPQVTILH